MRVELIGLAVLALSGCASQKIDDRQKPRPLPASAQQMLDAAPAILASTVVLRLQPELYGEVKYRVDQNFHHFEEKKVMAGTIIEMKNTSTLMNQPLRLWVGKLEIVATERIQAFFDSQAIGCSIDASGDVVWKKGKEVVRSNQVFVRDGSVQFIGRQ